MTKINQGIGFAVKEFIKEEIENKELEIIELKEGHPTNYISYVVPEGNNSNYTKALIDIIKP